MKAIVMLKITSGNVGDVCRALMQMKNILESCRPFGRYDAAIIVQAESLEEIWQIIVCQIKPIPGIFETFPCLLEEHTSLENLPEYVREFVSMED